MLPSVCVFVCVFDNSSFLRMTVVNCLFVDQSQAKGVSVLYLLVSEHRFIISQWPEVIALPAPLHGLGDGGGTSDIPQLFSTLQCHEVLNQ